MQEEIKQMIPIYKKKFGCKLMVNWNFIFLWKWEYELLKSFGAINSFEIINSTKYSAWEDVKFENEKQRVKQIIAEKYNNPPIDTLKDIKF